MRKWNVYEDNGGGLTLCVFEDDQCIYIHTGYEYNKGQLKEDLKALESGEDPKEWEGNLVDEIREKTGNPDLTAQELYEQQFDITDNEAKPGMWLIADQDGVYTDNMESAGRNEFC